MVKLDMTKEADVILLISELIENGDFQVGDISHAQHTEVRSPNLMMLGFTDQSGDMVAEYEVTVKRVK